MSDRTGPIHKTRVVYNSNVNIVQTDANIHCSRPTWTWWLAQANALQTVCDSRSYAQVLRQGKAVVQPNQVSTKIRSIKTHKVTESFYKTKNASNTSKNAHNSDTVEYPIHAGQRLLKTQLIPTFNRFQPLQDVLHTDDVEHGLIDKQDAGHAVYSSLFTGNKNKTGKKLGSAHPASGHSMHGDLLNKVSGCNKNKTGKKLGSAHPASGHSMYGDLLNKVSGCNKNKTGKSLGQSHSHAEQHALQNIGSNTLGTRPVHVSLKFKGNKNGNGSKLGHMHNIAEDTQHNVMLASRNYDHQVTHNPASIHFSGNKNGNGTKLGLQAVQHDTGENTIPVQTYTDTLHLSDPTVTDAQQLPCKRTRQIPSQVYAARFQSSDHKNCLYQNDKNFGFIPLNDLMVYTGPEVIWVRYLM